MRGHGALAAPTGDVDLLIARDGAPAVEGAAAGVGGVVHLRTWAGGSQCFLLAADPPSGWSVIVHVVDRLAFGPYGALVVPGGDGVVGRRVRDGRVWRADDGDELWVTLLHCLLDKGGVTPKHHDRLRALAAGRPALDREPAALVDRLRPGGLRAADVVELVATGRWDDVDALAGPLRDAWWRAAGWDAARRCVTNHASLLARKAAETATRRGAIVAVLAPDGAGKSTLVGALAGTMVGLPVRRFYAGAYGAALEARLPAIPGLRLVARVVLLAATGLRARWHRRRRRVALLDRHPMEVAPDGNWRRALLSRTVPSPDLVLVLDAPGDELHRRSGEHDAEVLERMRRRYAELAARTPAAVVIDATQPAGDVAAAARAAIWMRVTSRWQP